MTTYNDLGYNKYGRKDTPLVARLPYVPENQTQFYFQAIPGELVRGGKIYSKDEKLMIDLENGKITYNDGVTEDIIAG